MTIMKVAYLIWQSGKSELIWQKHVRIYCVYNNLYIKTYSQKKVVKVYAKNKSGDLGVNNLNEHVRT